MGTDTKLYLSSDIELERIKIFIARKFETRVRVTSCHKTRMGMFIFSFRPKRGTDRNMWVHMTSETPIGEATQLSLGHNEEAIRIMTVIAEHFGGILDESDCDPHVEFVYKQEEEVE